MHRFAPVPQRRLPAHLKLELDEGSPYTLITSPATSVPPHLLASHPTPPMTGRTTPLASPATTIPDFMTLMQDTSYLQHVLANRIQLSQLEQQPYQQHQPYQPYQHTLSDDEPCMDLNALYDPLLADTSADSLYLSPLSYDTCVGAGGVASSAASDAASLSAHRRTESQASLQLDVLETARTMAYGKGGNGNHNDDGDDDDTGSLKRKRSHDDDDDDGLDGHDTAELKRQTHIQSEQKRRAQIKDGFEELRQQLPMANLSSKKMSKAAILANTVIYLQQLKASHQALMQQVEHLQKENEQLRTLRGNMFGV